jgi:hypothetical protein
MPNLQYIRSSASAPYGTPLQPVSAASPLPCLLFGIQIGLDTSNNFALSVDPHSVEIGLAVRTPSGRFLRMERRHDRLIDVTSLVVAVNPWAYRLPVPPEDVRSGDLIITADPPDFSALYVLDREEGGRILGLDTGTCQEVRFSPAVNPFLNFYVKVVSLFDVFAS